MAPAIQATKNWVARNFLFVTTLIGVIAGLIIGFSVRTADPSKNVQDLMNYPGELYVRALRMLIIPVVICSMFAGAATLEGKSSSKLIGFTFGYFLVTSLFNALVGVILAVVVQPGKSSGLQSGNVNASSVTQSLMNVAKHRTVLDNFLDLGRNLIPPNLFEALTHQTFTTYTGNGTSEIVTKSTIMKDGSNMLGLIAVSITFGLFVKKLGSDGTTLVKTAKNIEGLLALVMNSIISLTPLGVASIIAGKIVEVPDMYRLMAQLSVFIGTVLAGILFYQLIVMPGIYYFVTRKNPFAFYMKVLPAALTGFSADSSFAAMPVTLQCLDDKVKTDSNINHFVVPIGVVVNMDGTALFVAIASVFIAQLNNTPLDIGSYVTVCVMATAVSIATAAAPSASITLMGMVLSAIGTPIKNLELLYAVDWLVDRIRTTNNVLGDCYTAAVVDHLFKKDKVADVAAKNNIL